MRILSYIIIFLFASLGVISPGIVVAQVEQNVMILWEADSYTPPFYKGKALYPPSGDVLVTALVSNMGSSGIILPSEDFVYQWRHDGVVLGSRSGLGKNILTIKSSVLNRPPIVEVEVSTRDGQVVGSDAVSISSVDPVLALYIKDPLQGVLFTTLIRDVFRLEKDELLLEAYPYYFSGQRTAPVYTWHVAGRRVSTPNTSGTFRRPEGRGLSSVSVEAQHQTKILQSADTSVQITFGSDE